MIPTLSLNKYKSHWMPTRLIDLNGLLSKWCSMNVNPTNFSKEKDCPEWIIPQI